jgi:Ger(x)C family germination protein
MWGALLSLLTGCSPDVHEISDIALVTITGVDYDEQNHKYIFTCYSIHPSAGSLEKSEKKSEWIASASGDSIVDAARNLRSRAGKTLIWQHDKFFIVGENAARHSFHEIVDFLSRSREIRMSSYIIVSEGEAADKIMVKSETGDLVSNEFLGKVMNENLWGKSLTLKLKDINNYYADPYRGFVTGRLSASKPINSSREVLFLSGGSVFNKGKLVGWLKGKDVLSIHLLTKKKEWENLEFPESVPFKSSEVTLLMKVADRSMHSSQTNGKPSLVIDLHLTATIVDMNQSLPIADPATLGQLERAAAEHIKKSVKDSLTYFQNGLKVDVIGFSDYFTQYHPNEWKKIKSDWTNVYPTIPVTVNVVVNILNLGMNEFLGGI